MATNDIDKDGFLEVIEATPATGPEIMQLADPALGLAGLPKSFPKSDAAGNLSFSATYDLNTTDLLFDVDNNIKHEPGDLLPLDKRVYEIHGLFVNNDNPPVPNDLPEILGPTHAYVMELPAAAGELRLVSVPEPGTLWPARDCSRRLCRPAAAQAEGFMSLRRKCRSVTARRCKRACAPLAPWFREAPAERVTPNAPRPAVFSDAAKPGKGLPCTGRKGPGCSLSCRP